MSINIKTSTKINELVIKARQNDGKALKALTVLFEPLIYKTSALIRQQYCKHADLFHVINHAKHIFMCLTLTRYEIRGRARFPYFIKKYLYAELIQLYRLSTIDKNTTNIENIENALIAEGLPCDRICAEERNTLISILHAYIDTNFTERERAIVYDYICGKTPRNELAKRYHISKMRMKYIHSRCIKKLNALVTRLGIKKGDI